MYRNVASQIITGQLNSKTDGSEVTTGTTTIYITIDGGTQAAGSVGSGACTHEGHGCWSYTPSQGETNGSSIAYTFTNSTAVTSTVTVFPIVLDDFADAILKRDWSSVTGEAARSVLNALRFLRNKWSISGGTLTVTKENDTTSAWTSTLTTDAGAVAVTTSDPA